MGREGWGGRGGGKGGGGLQWRVCNRTPALSVFFALLPLSSPALARSSLLCERLNGIAAFLVFGVTGGNWKQRVFFFFFYFFFFTKKRKGEKKRINNIQIPFGFIEV